MTYILRILIIMMFSLSLQANDTEFFKPTYEASRENFLSFIPFYEKETPFKIGKGHFPDPVDANLLTDWVTIKSQKKTQNLLVFISGTHGIEGYTGSALQSRFLSQLKATKELKYDLLMVHALNPYGFKNDRRVTRGNVDLNRNFMVKTEDFQTKNEAYQKIDHFLNPKTPVEVTDFSRWGFVFSAVKMILQSSLEGLRQAILVGQYQLPQGIFYGGARHEYQQQIIDQLVEKEMHHYKNVFVVDLHTGYGEKNKLHVLANNRTSPSSQELIQIFSEERIDFGDKEKFYAVTGDLLGYIEKRAKPEQTITGIVFEFGTQDSQKLLGSVESLRRMVIENQKHHFEAKDPESAKKVHELFRSHFYPENDESFKQTALEQFDTEVNKILQYLNK